MCSNNLIVNEGDTPENLSIPTVKKQHHHEQLKLCETRPAYRQGRKLTAVKVYTVNNESKYLIISGIPDIKIGTELSNMCLKFGKLTSVYPLPDYPSNRFELTYLVKYMFVRNARKAKKVLDGKSFFGGVLHVCYAPELESLEETREKLIDRRKSVAFQNIRLGKTFSKESNVTSMNDKTKIMNKVNSTFHNFQSIINTQDTRERLNDSESSTRKPIFLTNETSSKVNIFPKKSKKCKNSYNYLLNLETKKLEPSCSYTKSNYISTVAQEHSCSIVHNPEVSVTSSLNYPEKINVTKIQNKLKPFKVKSFKLNQPSMDYLKKPISLKASKPNK